MSDIEYIFDYLLPVINVWSWCAKIAKYTLLVPTITFLFNLIVWLLAAGPFPGVMVSNVHCLLQCFGSGSAWIRIKVDTLDLDPDPH